MTIMKVKMTLERKFGTPYDQMALELRDTSEAKVCDMADNDATLGSYSPMDNFTIHVRDLSGDAPVASQFDDVSKVEKYKISEKDYAKRDDTFRNFKSKMMAANPNFMNNAGDSAYEDFQKEEAEVIEVESRCMTNVGQRRGTVRFVGKVPGLGAGYWIGIELDEPTGDTNGSVKNKKYFEVADKFGVFIRPAEIKVGDYPPLDDFDEDEDEI